MKRPVKKVRERAPFHVGLGAFVAVPSTSSCHRPPPPLPVPFLFLPSCLPFSHSSLGKQQWLAGSPETTTTYSEKRQPVFHAVSPFCLPAATRAPHDSFPPPDQPREKRLAEHENLKAQRPLRPPRGHGRYGGRGRGGRKRFFENETKAGSCGIDVTPKAIAIIFMAATLG